MTTSEVDRFSLSHLLTVIGDTQSCQYFRSLQNQQTLKLGELETYMERVGLHFPLSNQDIVVAISDSGLQKEKKNLRTCFIFKFMIILPHCHPVQSPILSVSGIFPSSTFLATGGR